MPTGRPSKLTPALINRIADCFFDGLNDAETALLCDIDERSIRRYRAGSICPVVKKAETARLQKYIIKIRDGKQRDWVRIAWFLERRYPERFAKPEIQLSFNNSYTQNNLSINISSSDAKAIEAEAKPVREVVSEMYQKYRPTLSNGNSDDKSSE